MLKTILFIDGENFLHKIRDVLKKNSVDLKKIDLTQININFLLEKSFAKQPISKKIFYAAKLHTHPETKQQSEKLIKFQRKLRNNLINQEIDFEMAGHVRGQEVRVDSKTKVIFKEKGVDVKIAVDLVAMAADKVLTTAILCSSDSDLQPAVKELRKRNVEVVYLGFEFQPNKGLTFTTNRTVLFRNSEILEACGLK